MAIRWLSVGLLAKFLLSSNINTENASSWLLNYPDYFLSNKARNGVLIDDKAHGEQLFGQILNGAKSDVTDGEDRDAYEHFFYGMKGGLAIELGAYEGDATGRTMTRSFQDVLGWKLILIEGAPGLFKNLKVNAPEAICIGACICKNHQNVHYVSRGTTSGVLEFMSPNFLKHFYQGIYHSTFPRGNISSIDFSSPQLRSGVLKGVTTVNCLPLDYIFKHIDIHHINLFILDVEGSEYEALQSINWELVRFDVICGETEQSQRSAKYFDKIYQLLTIHAYKLVGKSIGRNSWFIHQNFTPSARPGVNIEKCWQGANVNVQNVSCKT